MRVLVLGGTGFLGRHVVAALDARGHEVIVGGRRPAPAPETSRHDVDAPTRRVARFEDLTEPSRWIPLIEDVDAVVNCVGILRERGRATFERVHLVAPAALAAACARLRLRRLIHVSALGLRKEAQSRFVSSKLRGEMALAASGVAVRGGAPFAARRSGRLRVALDSPRRVLAGSLHSSGCAGRIAVARRARRGRRHCRAVPAARAAARVRPRDRRAQQLHLCRIPVDAAPAVGQAAGRALHRVPVVRAAREPRVRCAARHAVLVRPPRAAAAGQRAGAQRPAALDRAPLARPRQRAVDAQRMGFDPPCTLAAKTSSVPERSPRSRTSAGMAGPAAPMLTSWKRSPAREGAS